MFAAAKMPSTTAVLSAYTAFTASTMLVRSVINEIQTMINQIIPQKLQEKILLRFGGIFGNLTSQMMIIIDESNGVTANEIYQASEIYLATKIIHSVGQLKVYKAPNEKNLAFTMNKGETITDEFEGIQITWEFVCTETEKTYYNSEDDEVQECRSYRLSFHKKYKEKVMNTYLQYVVDRSKAIKLEKKVVKLHASLNSNRDSIVLEHPFTFDTLAIDPKIKKELIDDLDRFLRREKFYRRVGKAWKRGYLLYGPPGTGKSSLIAAMANYLKFDIYDLELTRVRSNSELRRLLLSTGNRSILVIEDIDCSVELHNREDGGLKANDRQVTLSGLLNVIDGLWSNVGDERIIVFTTNYKDRLDPALLRPGRMDMHIHMSYLSPIGFEIMAFNYLQIKSHILFKDIEELIEEVEEVTPAEIAEELMRGEDADVVLEGVVRFLLRKKKLKYECKDGKDVSKEKEEEVGIEVESYSSDQSH